MGSKQLKQDFVGVDYLHMDLARLRKAMGDELDSIRQTAERFVATWDGDAQAEYYRSQQKWNTAATELNEILMRIGGAVETGNRNMRDLEGVLKNKWQAR